MENKVIVNKSNFYKKLFLYKSFLYKNVRFESNIDDEEVKDIIKALNIKKRSKRIEFIYDYCCDKIDKFYAGKDLCKFKNNQCIIHQIPNCTYKNGCCRICSYQSNKGCTTRNLSCKLFYCDKVKQNNEIIKFRDLKILKLLTLRQRLMVYENFFASREEFLTELKVGLLIFHSSRIVLRLIRHSFKIRRNNM